MSKLGIGTGITPDDGNGDSLLDGAVKINSNFDEIYSYFGDGTNLSGSWQKVSSGITTTLNVGIATTNPRFPLEVGAVGSSGTSLHVNGDARITGILTVGSSSITLDGSTNKINIGSGVTIDGSSGSISVTSIEIGGETSAGFGVTSITAGSGISIDQSTGNVTITAAGGGESYWDSSPTGIHTLSNVGIGTTNPTSALTVDGTLSVSGVSTFSNSVKLPDNTSILLGNNSDLQIYHDSVNGNIIRDIDDKLILDTGYFAINADSSAGRFAAVQCPSSTGEVQLRHPSGLKLQTKEFGINVTGITSTDQLSVGDIYDVNTGSGTFTASAGIAYTADSYVASDFVNAEYTLFFQHSSGIQSQKVLVMDDGTTAYSQEYGIMSSNDLLVSVGATVKSGNVELWWTPEVGVNGITTYRFTRHSMI